MLYIFIYVQLRFHMTNQYVCLPCVVLFIYSKKMNGLASPEPGQECKNANIHTMLGVHRDDRSRSPRSVEVNTHRKHITYISTIHVPVSSTIVLHYTKIIHWYMYMYVVSPSSVVI